MRIVVLFLLSISFVFALKLEDISQVMQKNIDESLRILEQEKTDKTKSADKIFALFDGIFDYDFMAKLSLSTRYDTLNTTEKGQYNRAFEANLKKSFTDKLSLYDSQKLKVVNLTEQGKRVFLKTSMVVDGKENFVVFKFYNKDSDWKIYDVDIFGISIIQTYRSQFKDVLANADFDTLLNKLSSVHFE
ncbi:ABC transporter substrate-binding protein [Campylobacter insulaenigrae]|uniref:MlaC/ttg2D family ABC transporter substrate-binding protein n=1 Tax=Campylobacter insulaenigrae TaxID=260714 RepID=UPI002152F33E|nr:ABC transporter substrate-binding protein [Campylobacter insulaenigrae]MCR6574121.1 ABC transporter substrate-binding protein [Campylobacter insulaenigrae]MCR6575124.1 ABC transporter substrate-binding protein [Campylobacter insulaenigrae]MCR6580070.1 ABC transporter substrate-binding protein [Campylobacter insulaenigrae]MCR6586031.1 ABC transporter substrate-binding protein [Campylobacter insulaenigrae]MCR6587776.1 ABC transporter substrate-binding protein [Campylobacter insulaenigrae]